MFGKSMVSYYCELHATKNLILLIINTLLITLYINKPYLEALENPKT